jgi:Flp pilus assembly protein TadD
MTTLYEVLGARPSDNAQAIKKAFRTAVKAYHPDLHPGDPVAALRFRRIITANAILRDEKQRAAYDDKLAQERRQISFRHTRRVLQLQHHRRRTRLKLGAVTAAVAACLLAGVYGLFMPVPTTAVVGMASKPPNAKAATVDTIGKDKVAAASVAVAPTVTVGNNDDAAAGGTGKATRSIGEPLASLEPPPQAPAHQEQVRQEEAGAVPLVRAVGVQAGTHTATDGAASAVDADHAPTPAVAADKSAKGSNALAVVELPPLPKDANFFREMGVVSYRIGDFQGAIVKLDEAIRLDPADALAYDIRGNARDQIGSFESALADYDAAIRLDPNNPILFHDRAIMWHRKGELDKALGDLDRAIRFTFSDPILYCDRGLIWYEKGSHTRAVADFNNAIKLDPDGGAACISRGLILHRYGEFSVALADVEKTIRVSPSVFDVGRRSAPHP